MTSPEAGNAPGKIVAVEIGADGAGIQLGGDLLGVESPAIAQANSA